MSEEDLLKINNRRMNQQYHDAKAAQVLFGSPLKGKLTETPFVRVFEFGCTNGYWTGNHTIIQVEDCKDCLDSIFGDKFLFVFLFDHSSGHAKKRANGLDVKNMIKGWGGNRQTMRPTLIMKPEGFVGPFHNPNNPEMVRIGCEQS